MQTGEENEDTIFQVRGKLYALSDQNQWKERGTGLLKLNVRKSDAGGARLGKVISCLVLERRLNKLTSILSLLSYYLRIVIDLWSGKSSHAQGGRVYFVIERTVIQRDALFDSARSSLCSIQCD